MKFTIYSDLHFGQISEILNSTVPSKGDIFLGDIFDIKNTSKKDITTQLLKQKIFINECKAVGADYVQGNHDLKGYLPLFVKIGNVLFTHGHLIFWDQATIDEWAAKKPNGVGFFRGITLAIQNLYTRGVWKPSEIEIDRAVKLARDFGCDTICFGHSHTKEIVDFERVGIRIVNLPRGKTEIEL